MRSDGGEGEGGDAGRVEPPSEMEVEEGGERPRDELCEGDVGFFCGERKERGVRREAREGGGRRQTGV